MLKVDLKQVCTVESVNIDHTLNLIINNITKWPSLQIYSQIELYQMVYRRESLMFSLGLFIYNKHSIMTCESCTDVTFKRLH